MGSDCSSSWTLKYLLLSAQQTIHMANLVPSSLTENIQRKKCHGL